MPATVLLREHVAGAPHRLLAPYVARYGGFRERTDGPTRRRELPMGGVAVILALDNEWRLGTGVGAGVPMERFTSFVGGLIDRPVVAEHAGSSWSLQFDLTPVGSLALFGVPGRELSGRVVALDALLGDNARLLVDRLVDVPSWGARFAILDEFLLPRITGAPPLRPDVAWAWSRLADTSGQVPIGTLVRELGCSPRHLAARFGEAIGMTPKAYGRLLRFERAVALLCRGDEELGQIAAGCGFSDQAHFTRELTAFAGTSPTALLAERRPDGGFVL